MLNYSQDNSDAELLLNKGYEVHGIKRRASSFNTQRVDHIYEDSHIENKYFELYKDFFVSKVKKYKINFIFETRSDNNTITELVLSPECYFSKKERISNMLIRLKINENCEDLK